MNRTTFNAVKKILRDYPKIDKYIEQRKMEIKFPYRQPDVNSDIKGNAINDTSANLIITIEQDKRLIALERQKAIIEHNLDQASERQRVIIEELYFKERPTYTTEGLASQVLFIDVSNLHRLRNEFFESVALDLGLIF